MTDGYIDHQKVVEIEREMINFMRLLSIVTIQLNDFGLSEGFNPERIARKRDESKRIEKMISVEVKEKTAADENFEAIAYIKQRAEDLRLNPARLDNLLSKGRWRGYR